MVCDDFKFDLEFCCLFIMNNLFIFITHSEFKKCDSISALFPIQFENICQKKVITLFNII